MIITAHTSPICSYTLVIVHITSTKWKFSCVLYAHSQFLCKLQVSNCQPWVSAIPAAKLLIDCYSIRHSRSLVFLQLLTALTQHWVYSAPCFNALPDIFAIMNCSVLALSGCVLLLFPDLESADNQFVFVTVTHCSLQRVKSACRIICTGTPENGGMTGALSPLLFQKSGNGGGGVFHTGPWEPPPPVGGGPSHV